MDSRSVLAEILDDRVKIDSLVRGLFQQFDENQKGFLTTKELKKAFKKLCEETLSKEPTTAQVRDIVKEFGEPVGLHYEGFINMIQKTLSSELFR